MEVITKKPETIDEYLALYPQETQEILQRIRKMSKKAAPEATEVISYGVPTLKLNGTYFIYFAGYKNHVSIYPIPNGDEKFAELIKPFKAGKGTLQFPLNKPIPWPVIETVISEALQTNLDRTKTKKTKKTKK